MKIHGLFCGAAVFGLALMTEAHAAVPPPSPIKLFEAQSGPNEVTYTISNPSGGSVIFDITVFAVSLPSQPVAGNLAAPAGWSAQFLQQADWGLPIGGLNGNPTWAQFTATPFTSVFQPGDNVLGFYVTIAPDAQGKWTYLPQSPVKPGQTLSGFSRPGVAASDFIAAGPSDSSTFVGDTDDDPTLGVGGFSGAATPVPEPTSAGLLLAGCAVFLRRRR